MMEPTTIKAHRIEGTPRSVSLNCSCGWSSLSILNEFEYEASSHIKKAHDGDAVLTFIH